MLVFDTNILIYALDAGAEMHQSCVNRLEQARRDAVPSYLTWSVCYEFLRVATHPRVLARPRRLEEAWEFLESLLDSPGISILRPTERHMAVLAQTIREAPDLRGKPRARYAYRRAYARAWPQPDMHDGRRLPPLLLPLSDGPVEFRGANLSLLPPAPPFPHDRHSRVGGNPGSPSP